MVGHNEVMHARVGYSFTLLLFNLLRTTMKSITLRSVASLGALSLLLAACAQEIVEPVEEPVVEIIEEEVVVDVPRHPLTGFELGAEALSGPSISIKIDNTSAGRPQVGIASADLVFEELVEGGVTRYLAVFHTVVPEEVGPVRSGRPQDSDLIAPLGGLFVFSGVGNSNVREIIRGSGVQLVEHDTSGGTPDGKFFFRSNRKSAPMNLHIQARSLLEGYATLSPSVQKFQYRTNPAEATAVVSGVDASSVRAVFSSGVESIWKWDEASGTYLKFLSNGSPDNDADGTQISATNVVVLSPNYFDVEGLPTALISGQTDGAYIATGGKLLEGRFVSTAAKDPIQLTYKDGSPVYLTPGKTFVLLPPGESSQATGVKPGSFAYTSNGQEIVIRL